MITGVVTASSIGAFAEMIMGTEVTFGAATGMITGLEIAFGGTISGEKILPLRVIFTSSRNIADVRFFFGVYFFGGRSVLFDAMVVNVPSVIPRHSFV